MERLLGPDLFISEDASPPRPTSLLTILLIPKGNPGSLLEWEEEAREGGREGIAVGSPQQEEERGQLAGAVVSHHEAGRLRSWAVAGPTGSSRCGSPRLSAP